MHSLRSSLVKSAIGLSSGELRRTSISDKQWLGISEEQLINDTFTDEFYHRLHNPDNIWYSQNDVGSDDSEPFPEPDSTPNRTASSDQIFLQYLLRSDPLVPDAVESLIRDLLQVSLPIFS